MAKNDIPRNDTLTSQENSSATVSSAVINHDMLGDNRHDYAKKTDDSGEDVADGLEYIDATEIDGEDTHRCTKCNIEFKSLEKYIRHKLSTDKCKVAYSRKKHKLIPKIIKAAPSEDSPELKKPKYTGKKRGPKQRHVTLAHNQSDILTESESQYNCEICGASFRRSAALRWHVDNEHKKKDSDLDITSSDENAEDPEFIPAEQSLKDEIVEESGEISANDSCITVLIEKPNALKSQKCVCNICGRTLKDAYTLRAHLLTHTEERYFTCPYNGCENSFKTKGSLKRHMRRHTGERPYKCDQCHRTFSESGALTRHMKAVVPCSKKLDSNFPRYGRRKPFTKMVKEDEQIASATAVVGEVLNTCNTTSGINIELLQQTATQQNIDLSDRNDMANTNDFPNNADIAQEEIAASPPVEQEAEMASTDLSCKVCLEQFPSKNLLQDHLKTLIGNCPLKCGLCSFVSDDLDTFLVHLNQSDHLQQNPDGNIGPETENEDMPVLDIIQQPGTVCIMPTDEPSNVVFETVTSDYTMTAQEDLAVFTLPIENSQPEDSNAVYDETNIDKDEMSTMLEHVQDESEAVMPDCQTEDVEMQVVCDENDQEQFEENNLLNSDGNGHTDVPILEIKTFADEAAGNLTETAENELQTDPLISDDCVQTSVVLQDDAHSKDGLGLALEQLFSLHKTTSDKKQSLFTCPICFRNMKAAAYLKLHMKTHLSKKEYICQICQKSFIGKDALNKHVITHSAERNYKCGECNKLFKRISHVREHLKVHSDNRPFPCTICFKSFKSANASRVHMRTHSTIMPFRCMYCQKQFREKSSLQRHIRSHTGEKPFYCRHCKRGFAEHGTLNRHLRAKVPCYNTLPEQGDQSILNTTPNLHSTSPITVEQAIQEGINVTLVSQDTSEFTHKSEVLDNTAESPTMLAEFSNMVADTQQYMVSEEQTITGENELEFVHGEDAVKETDDTVVIVYDDGVMPVDQTVGSVDAESNFVLVEDGGKVLVLNTQTGETYQAPGEAIQVETEEMVDSNITELSVTGELST